MQRAVVTGAGGFLGRHLVRDLRRHGVRVTSLSREARAQMSLPDVRSIAMGNAPWCSIRLAEVIEAVEPEVIYHLVGGAAEHSAALDALNVGVTKSLMEALRIADAHPLLVCCGSAAEYGAAILDGVPVHEGATCAPTSAYGAAKLAQTNAALAFAEATATRVLIARIFNPIGPGMPTYLALGEFARQIAMLRTPHGVLRTGNIHVSRDFIDVEHVAWALESLAHNPDACGVVNICSGEATELSRLVDILIDASGKTIAVSTDSARLRPGELGVVIGSTARLAGLGAEPPRTDYAGVVERIWRDAEVRWAGAS